jgi:hypothetical protein
VRGRTRSFLFGLPPNRRGGVAVTPSIFSGEITKAIAANGVAGAIKMTRIEELKRERAFAAHYLARLKAGLIETLDAEGDGPLIDRTRKTIARLTRRIAVLDALLKRVQATSTTPASS